MPCAVPGLVDRERAHLGEVLPHHVQRAAADDGAVVVLGDAELLDVLVVGDGLLAEHDAVVGVSGHQRAIARTSDVRARRTV
jgi:hypothetical protein